MADKPSYLGLLNAIAVAESRAHTYLCAWADVTDSDDVRAVLCKVAAREGEHAMSFAKRIDELGYSVRRKDDQDVDKRIALVTSDCSDLEKMEALKLHRLDSGDKPDIFDDFFKDHSIDIATGELLGRYIAEERDTARLLRHCYEQLRQQSTPGSSRSRADDRLASLERTVDALCSTVGELRDAISDTTSGSNGSRAKARVK
jgi:Mn-containing catalase